MCEIQIIFFNPIQIKSKSNQIKSEKKWKIIIPNLVICTFSEWEMKTVWYSLFINDR